MAAHPVAFAGFFAHTGALDDPYARLERTATVMNAIAFGTRAQADRLTAHVRAMHRACAASCPSRPARSRPARPTAATTPSTCCGSSARWPSRRCSSTTSTPARSRATRRTSCGATTASSGACSACASATCPRDIDGFEAYMAERYASPELVVTPQARELAIDIVLRPPVPLHLRPRARAGQPDHGRAAAAAPCASSTASPGTRARRRAARRRGVRQARASCPCCPSACGCCRSPAPPSSRRLARQLAVHAAPDARAGCPPAARAGAAPRGASW